MNQYRLDYDYIVKANRGAYHQATKRDFTFVKANNLSDAIKNFKKDATAIKIISIVAQKV